jgi:hypothetical protein
VEKEEMTLGLQFGGGPKYSDYYATTSAHPSDPSPEITHPLEAGGSTASTPQWPADWDEDQYQRTWGQQDMSEQPDIPTAKVTGGTGNRRPMDKYGD